MSQLPILDCDQVQTLVPAANNIVKVGAGGQKIVFAGDIGEKKYALKFATVPDDIDLEQFENDEIDMEDTAIASSAVVARAKREVETMHDCDSNYMVKLGPISLEFRKLNDQNLIFFSEELIDGKDLRDHLKSLGPLSVDEVTKLGIQIADAIEALWKLKKVHRDIKPGNIMYSEERKDFILLDAGLAFDVVGESLSILPVGTPPYFSPEQFNFVNRRSVLDFRSDLFSLGVTMYEMLTGTHPFFSPGDNSNALYNKILNEQPVSPIDIRDDIPQKLNRLIMRLLGKSAHLRFRNCGTLIESLKNI
jgi:serine/threonine protein kinase